MNKLLMISAFVMILTSAFSANSSHALSDIEREKLRYRRTGGEIVARGSFTGHIALVNKQSKLPASEIKKVASLFREKTGCNVTFENCDTNANIKLTIVDDLKAPTTLVAAEDRWGQVNIANIVSDLNSTAAKEKFFTIRSRKLIIKTLSVLCGGGSSSYQNNVMNAARIRDLDYCEEQIPVDVLARHLSYLPNTGVKPLVITTYKKACREGWAPPPTNEIQKAIWDKVHAIPKNPMKIEFDPKKGR